MKKMKKMMPWSKLPSSRLERQARGRHKEPWCRRAETSKQKSLQYQGRVGKLEPQLTVVGGLEWMSLSQNLLGLEVVRGD